MRGIPHGQPLCCIAGRLALVPGVLPRAGPAEEARLWARGRSQPPVRSHTHTLPGPPLLDIT